MSNLLNPYDVGAAPTYSQLLGEFTRGEFTRGDETGFVIAGDGVVEGDGDVTGFEVVGYEPETGRRILRPVRKRRGSPPPLDRFDRLNQAAMREATPQGGPVVTIMKFSGTNAAPAALSLRQAPSKSGVLFALACSTETANVLRDVKLSCAGGTLLDYGDGVNLHRFIMPAGGAHNGVPRYELTAGVPIDFSAQFTGTSSTYWSLELLAVVSGPGIPQAR